MPLFRELHVYEEAEGRAAAMNMAMDEALLEYVTVPSIRFYGWARRSLSFGYFGAFADVEPQLATREIVRRWTGGGIVRHGTDVTYSVILPRREGEALPRSQFIYSRIHSAIADALSPQLQVEIAAADAPKVSAACFANPVAADVLVEGRKIAGAAQRRTRAGLLHQGSIQLEALAPSFKAAFAEALSRCVERCDYPAELLQRAQQLAQEKYGTDAWLRQR